MELPDGLIARSDRFDAMAAEIVRSSLHVLFGVSERRDGFVVFGFHKEYESEIAVSDEFIISPDTKREKRLPPNQVRTLKWPVLDASGPPEIDLSTWQFEVSGVVQTPMKWTFQEFQSLPRVKVKSDFHCVTRWSRLDNEWEGVSAREILNRVGVLPKAQYVLVHAYDYDWTTNMPLRDFTEEDVLFADTHDGQPLSTEHGGPVRLVVPRLYAWKSAKWVRGVEFLEHDQAGYWEDLGYHMRGDPWKEERFK